MIRSLLLLAGLLMLLALPWLGEVVAPWAQSGGPVPRLDAGPSLPLSPAAARGRRLYIAFNCAACHTQQLGPADFPAAAARGWGSRRTVPRDLIGDAPPLLGARRVGPDLSSVGARHPVASWYGPILAAPGAGMPGYPSLFENGDPAAPTAEGRDLAAYLLSLAPAP